MQAIDEIPPAIDPAALAVFGDDPDKILRLMVTFCRVSPGLLANIRRGIAEHDAEKTRQAAHAMKSSNGMIGAKTMASLCQELEMLARMGQLDDSEALMAELDAEFVRVECDAATIMTTWQHQRGARMATFS
ncbi:MAG: Hpt domain-containing protein [Desulfobulbaceae bacterium]|nr:Hpt domain-containing protein [Desulfobulbaceae bacterium]